MPASRSTYIRVAPRIDARTTLRLPDASRVRRISEAEAAEIADRIRRRNVFSRHSWENNFYLERALGLGGRTVIEVVRVGQPADIARDAEKAADWLETLVILSTSLALKRDQLQRRLGVGLRQTPEVDLVLGPQMKHVRSRTRKAPSLSGVPVTKTDAARFVRVGFPDLFGVMAAPTSVGRRLQRCAAWLLDSRCDANPEAAVVKTAIALESMLILSASEPLTRSLMDRSAFLLSPRPEVRKRIAQVVRRLYEVRSAVVHGGRRRRGIAIPRVLEAGDRLCVLLMLALAANLKRFGDEDTLRTWLEGERWGPPSDLELPFSAIYVTRALRLIES